MKRLLLVLVIFGAFLVGCSGKTNSVDLAKANQLFDQQKKAGAEVTQPATQDNLVFIKWKDARSQYISALFGDTWVVVYSQALSEPSNSGQSTPGALSVPAPNPGLSPPFNPIIPPMPLLTHSQATIPSPTIGTVAPATTR